MATSRVVYDETPIAEGDITLRPGLLRVLAAPPDSIAFVLETGNGKFAAVEVDAQDLEAAIDGAHQKLIENAANQHEQAPPVIEEAPPPPPPADQGPVPLEEQPAEEQPTEEQPAE